jgi:Fe2+ or Zn2+ uptake regulation protein
MRWWLHSDPGAAGSLADVERALERLEADGEVERVAAQNGSVAYRIRSRR